VSGRVALVTGAGAGIGRAIATRLAREGRAGVVAINDLDPAAADDAAGEVTAAGGRGIACPADVTDWDAVRTMAERVVTDAGGIDVLVNNAGVPPGLLPQAFLDSDPAQWEPWLRLNLYGVMYASRAAVPSMVARGWGRVVTVVSDAGRVGEAGLTPYATGKAGAAGFMRSLAREVGPVGVTCNCVALGTIKHGQLAEFVHGDVETKMVKRYVVPRLGTPDDASAMVSFLCGEDADWITGQTFPVNGGFSMAV
jgi:3-oxoacyl-[acyl-carrier protein] reductase